MRRRESLFGVAVNGALGLGVRSQYAVGQVGVGEKISEKVGNTAGVRS